MFDVVIVALLMFVVVVGAPRKQSKEEYTDKRLDLHAAK
jgi:hypothetical protein